MTIAAPSREDPLVAGASRLTGGPWGRYAAGRTWSWLTPVRVVLALTVLATMFAFLQKAPCRTHAWADHYQYTRVCYTDVYALYFAEGLGGNRTAGGGGSRLSVPYRDHPVEYPAVIGGLMWAAAEVTNVLHPHQPSAGGDTRGRTFFDVTALFLTLCALVTAWTVARLAGRTRVWDAAMFALAPALVLYAFINWDLAAVALTSLAMYAWSRRSPALAGVFIGLGVATKLYPLLLLLALLFLCVRAGRVRDWSRTAGVSLVTFVVAYIPAWVLSKPALFPSADCPGAHPLQGWRWFWSLNQVRGPDWGSLWLAAQNFGASPLDSPACGQAPKVLNFAVALCTIAVVGGVSLLVIAAPRRPRLAPVLFLLVAGFIVVNKVDSPQYALWLLPLAVLAYPRWRMILLWQASEVLIGVANFYALVHNDQSTQGLPPQAYATAIVVRDVVLVVLMGLVVRGVLHPDTDVVRRDGADDPAGGILDGAPDRWSRAGAGASAAAPG